MRFATVVSAGAAAGPVSAQGANWALPIIPRMPDSLARSLSWIAATAIVVAALATGGGHETQGREASGYVGVTKASRQAHIGSARAGRLARVQVRDGDVVRSGQELFALESVVEQLEIERLTLLDESVVGVTLAEARLAEASAAADRIKELSDRQIASPARELEVMTALRVAEAQLASERELVKLRKIELEQARARLELLRGRSPFDGVVDGIEHSVGEGLDQLEPVLRVLALDPLHVEFPCPADESAMWAVGQECDVVESARSGTDGSVRRGRVVFRARAVDVASQTVLVRIELPNPDRDWLAGRKVRVSLAGT